MITEDAAALSVRLFGSTTTRVMDTPTLIGAMLDSGEGISPLLQPLTPTVKVNALGSSPTMNTGQSAT